MIFEPFARNALRLFGQICSKGRQKFDGSDRIFVAQNNFGAVETDGQNSGFRFQSFGIEKLRARKNKILKENTKQFKLGLDVSTFVSVSCHDQDRHQILHSCLDYIKVIDANNLGGYRQWKPIEIEIETKTLLMLGTDYREIFL
jgi:hypothetical protein